MRICPIASGSSGNCIYVGSDATHLLIDVGISGKKTEAGIHELDLDMRDVDGILITHEHSDHIQGLGVIARKYGIPIYLSEGTFNAISNYSSLGKIPKELFSVINPDEKFWIKDLCINPMRISHDAAQPVAYRISYGKNKIAVVTDLGNYDEYTVAALQHMDVLLLEANHDIRMLEVGPYPYPLKQRILSDKGHLSNERAGNLLYDLLHDNLKAVILGHLSKENNMPELAYESVRVELTTKLLHSPKANCSIHPSDFEMYVAKRNELSELIEL